MHPLHMDSQWKRSEEPPNGSMRLTHAATRGGRMGDPPPSSARPLHVARGYRGTHRLGSEHPQRSAREKRREGESTNQQRALPANELQERERERGAPPEQEGEGTPQTSTRANRTGHTGERRGGGPPKLDMREEEGG